MSLHPNNRKFMHLQSFVNPVHHGAWYSGLKSMSWPQHCPCSAVELQVFLFYAQTSLGTGAVSSRFAQAHQSENLGSLLGLQRYTELTDIYCMTCGEWTHCIASRIFREVSGTCNCKKKSANIGTESSCLRTCFGVIHIQWKFVWFLRNVGINLGQPGASEFKKINYWKIHRSCRFPICIECTVLQDGNHLYWYNFLKYQFCFIRYYFFATSKYGMNMAACTHDFIIHFGTLLMELYRDQVGGDLGEIVALEAKILP